MHKTEPPGNYFVRKTFRRFFLPSLLSSLGLSLAGIADAIVVGSRMGETGLAAIAFAAPVFMLFNTFDVGLGMGGSIRYSRLLSAGNTKDAVALFNHVLIISIALGAVLGVLGNLLLQPLLALLGVTPGSGATYDMAATYVSILLWSAPVFFAKLALYFFLRSDDNPRLAAIALVAGNLVDFALNFVFVLWMDMGVAGAVYSTVIGSLVTVICCLPHLFFKWSILRLKPSLPSLKNVWQCFVTGFASSSQYIYQFISLAVMNNIAIRLGGDLCVAVLDVMINVSYIMASLYDSVGSTLQPMASTFYGERNTQAVRETFSLSVRRGLLLSAVCAALCAIFAEPICRLFGLRAEESLTLGIHAIRVLCLGVPLGFISFILGSLNQAIDREKHAYAINLLRSFALPVLFAFVLIPLGQSAFFWLFTAAEGVCLLLVGSWFLVREKGFVHFPAFDPERTYHATLDNSRQDIAPLLQGAEEFFDRFGATMSQTYFAAMTVEEVCTAIIQNAFTGAADEYIQLTLVALENGEFELHLRDSARSFNPFEMKTRRIDADDDTGMDAIGILMVKKKAKKFSYQRHYDFNTLVIMV